MNINKMPHIIMIFKIICSCSTFILIKMLQMQGRIEGRVLGELKHPPPDLVSAPVQILSVKRGTGKFLQ